MRCLWYCPKCGYEELKDSLPKKNNFKGEEDVFDLTWTNIRDGYGTPIRHFLCNCGNRNAGVMHFQVVKDESYDTIEYFKSVIEMYQNDKKD